MIENPLEQVELLKKVQAIDVQILEIERQKGDIPQKLEELTRQREQERADIDTAKESLVALDADKARIEKEVAFDRDSLKNFEDKTKNVGSTDAYEAALKELDTRRKIIRDKEDEVIRLMEQTETVNKKIAQLENDFEEIGTKYEEQETELKKRVDQIEQDSAELRAERDGVTAGVDGALLTRYDRVFKQRDGIGIAPIVNEVCQGCYMGIPPQIANDARAGKEGVQTCPNCGRIIYWAPRDAPE